MRYSYTHFILALLLFLPSAVSAGVPEKLQDPEFKKSYDIGKNYYGFCMYCHARNGMGTALEKGGTLAPPLAGSPRVLGNKGISIRIVLHGLTGKVDGTIYEKNDIAMKPPPGSMATDDRIVTGLLNYIRNTWGNEAPAVTESDVQKVREKEATRKEPWTIEELMKMFPSEKTGTKASPTEQGAQ